MNKKNVVVASSSGVSFAGLLTVVLIYLKLTNQIDWSWLWVTCLIWLPTAIIASVFVCGLAVFILIILAADGKIGRKK